MSRSDNIAAMVLKALNRAMANDTDHDTEAEDAPLPPAIVFHSLAQAEAALAVAGELGMPVTLISAPSATGYAGPGWFRAVVDTFVSASIVVRFSPISRGTSHDQPLASVVSIRRPTFRTNSG